MIVGVTEVGEKSKSRPDANGISLLSTDELRSIFIFLTKKERDITGRLLLYLAEVDKRRFYIGDGYSSLFSYLTKKFDYSRSSAQRRIVAARAVGRFPELYDFYEANAFSLTTLSLISSILTEENFGEVVSETKGKSEREVESIVAYYRPEEKRRETIRTVWVEIQSESAKKSEILSTDCSSPLFQEPSRLSGPDVKGSYSRCGTSITTEADDTKLVPAGEWKGREERRSITFSLTKVAFKKFERVKALRSHKTGGKEKVEDLFDVLLEMYLEKHAPERRQVRREKRREKKAKKASLQVSASEVPNTKGNSKKDHENSIERRVLGAESRDTVLVRDSCQCQYVAPDGTRCTDECFVQLDHIEAFGKGGETTEENSQGLCAAHNKWKAEQQFGREFIEQRIQNRRLEKNSSSGAGVS